MMRDAAVQTDLPPASPPAYQDVIPIKSVERLRRFMVNNIKREYNVNIIEGTLSFSESMAWCEPARDPINRIKQDQLKFNQTIDDYIEVPSKALGLPTKRVWLYAMAFEKNFFRDPKFREFVRERAQESPQNWARKLCEDRAIVEKIIDASMDPKALKIKTALSEAIEKEINIWFTRLNSDSDWELSTHGAAHWSWRRPWMTLA